MKLKSYPIKLNVYFHKFSFVLYIFLWSDFINAQSTIIIPTDLNWQTTIIKELMVLPDEKNELSINQIFTYTDLPFKTNKGEKPTGHHYWAKTTLTNTSGQDLTLFFGSYFWDYVKIYIINEINHTDSVSIGIQSQEYQPYYTIKKYTSLSLVIEYKSSGMFRREENINLVIQKSIHQLKKNAFHNYIDGIIWGGVLGLTIYNLFLFISLRDKLYLWYCIYAISATLLIGSTFTHSPSLLQQYFLPTLPKTTFYIKKIFDPLAWIALVHFSRHFLHLNEKLPILNKVFKASAWALVLMFFINWIGLYHFSGTSRILPYSICMSLGFFTAIYMYYKGLFYSWYFIIAHFFLFMGAITAVLFYIKIDYFFFIGQSTLSEYIKSIKFNFMWYIGELTFFSFALSHKYNSLQQSIHDAKLQKEVEKQSMLQSMAEKLEKQIKERTNELNTSILKLKTTQSQLIHSEKMASLGELTSGIAHEIQNPLNFINNFSELNIDILGELTNTNSSTNGYSKDLIKLSKNSDKILLHGQRINGIVKGMLQHGKQSVPAIELTDINKLSDESLRLSYHSFRVKDKNFNIAYECNLDRSIEKIRVISQDISRVLLNIINNAFYACTERGKSDPANEFQGRVSLRTLNNGATIRILISDNGVGIPESVKSKIFQPFYTTKPTGEGTGLGLSISYDIITKGHGGGIKVRSKENEGTEFEIIIPIKYEYESKNIGSG